MKRIEFTPEMDAALSTAWCANLSLCPLVRRLMVGRSTLYRRAGELGLVARASGKIPRRQAIFLPRIPKRCHPLVKILYQAMRDQLFGFGRVAGAVGVSRETVANWGRTADPRVSNLVAAFNFCGYDLVVRSVGAKINPHDIVIGRDTFKRRPWRGATLRRCDCEPP